MPDYEALTRQLMAQLRGVEPEFPAGFPPLRQFASGVPGWPPEVDWTVPRTEPNEGYGGVERPIHESSVPLTGFLGPQRTKRGGAATVMNIGVNIGGREWIIPQLTPNQDPADILALLSEEDLSPAQQQRITDRAIEFAMEYERDHPGTFAHYNSVLDAETAARGESAGKGHVAPLPEPRPQYPGRR